MKTIVNIEFIELPIMAKHFNESFLVTKAGMIFRYGTNQITFVDHVINNDDYGARLNVLEFIIETIGDSPLLNGNNLVMVSEENGIPVSLGYKGLLNNVIVCRVLGTERIKEN
jgi:hypothetical protein